ncbi:MAG TPA: hypothetical protein VMW70_05340 [Burkholderiales bacterium]|nr:hypothetical protein [Burkholderiales bacterium]
MNDQHDLTDILRSRFPIVAIETHEEARVIALLERISNLESQALFVWTVTEGLSHHGRTDSIPLTRPLSVVASERINALREWASNRTVMPNG